MMRFNQKIWTLVRSAGACAALVILLTSSQLRGDGLESSASGPASAPSRPADSTAPPAGLLPISNLDKGLWDREYLTGDWGGARTKLADKGVQFDVQWIQTVQSVVSGVYKAGTDYGGSFDYLINFDLMRMACCPADW